MSQEAEISISGKKLDEGQSMTVRVAIQNFAITLQDGLGEDDIGQNLAKAYLERIAEINALLMETAR